MWTVQNVSSSVITVTDTPIPITWLPDQWQPVSVADIQQSAQLAQAIQNMQLCVVDYGAFAPLPRLAPMTYPVLGEWTPTGLQPVTLTQAGVSPPLTLGPFTAGSVLAVVWAVGSGATNSWSVSYQDWDGATYYPPVPVFGPVTTVGAVPPSGWPPSLLSGRFSWTVTGSVTVTLLYQVQ